MWKKSLLLILSLCAVLWIACPAALANDWGKWICVMDNGAIDLNPYDIELEPLDAISDGTIAFYFAGWITEDGPDGTSYAPSSYSASSSNPEVASAYCAVQYIPADDSMGCYVDDTMGLFVKITPHAIGEATISFNCEWGDEDTSSAIVKISVIPKIKPCEIKCTPGVKSVTLEEKKEIFPTRTAATGVISMGLAAQIGGLPGAAAALALQAFAGLASSIDAPVEIKSVPSSIYVAMEIANPNDAEISNVKLTTSSDRFTFFTIPRQHSMVTQIDSIPAYETKTIEVEIFPDVAYDGMAYDAAVSAQVSFENPYVEETLTATAATEPIHVKSRLLNRERYEGKATVNDGKTAVAGAEIALDTAFGALLSRFGIPGDAITLVLRTCMETLRNAGIMQ